ncbi:hypothetical protein [Nostoc sp.]|uniref:hypothetical protein n=1 Tax=Nostoc sp. TaxID=1180 RepID=UPI002FFA43EE
MHLRSQLLGGCLLPNGSRCLTLYPLPCLPSRVLSFNPFIQNGELQKRDNSALARLGVLLPTPLGSVMKIVESIRWAGLKFLLLLIQMLVGRKRSPFTTAMTYLTSSLPE